MNLSKHYLLACVLLISVALPVLAQPVWAQSANPHAVSLYNLGLSAYKQGSPESAIIFFKRAADIDPDLADAQYNLGVLYQSQRRLREAVPRFEEVLRVKPQDQDAQFQLGLALIDLSRAGDARQHLLSVAPNSAHFAEAQKKIALIDSQMTGQPAGQRPTINPPANSAPETPPSTGTSPPSSTFSEEPHPSQPNIPATQPNIPSTAVVPQNNPPPAPVHQAGQVVATGFSAPSGLAFDKQGNLYVANFLTNVIDRISRDGTKRTFVSGVNLKGPIGLAIDESGYLYVANYLAGNIVRISPAGISSVIASGFRKPYYLALDHEGNLFVSQQEDNSVVRVTLPKAQVQATQPH